MIARTEFRNRRRGSHRALAVVLGVLALLLASPPAAVGQIIEYYHVDALGSVRVVTDATGQVIERHDYLPFGEEWNPASTAGQSRRFTGKERDGETGYDYFGARYLESGTGRFTTVDPVQTIDENLTDPQRWNRYAYARNNPYRWVDPDGRAIDTIWDVGNLVYDIYTGIKTGNWTDFGVDLVATAVPFVPAGASKLRHLGKVDDAANAVKALERTEATSRAARRATMREQGIPTSQQPTWQVNTPGGRSYEYEVAGPGGSKQTKVVTQHPVDPRHGPHWEAGTAKPGSTDSLGRTRHYNQDPATKNPKSQVGYREP